MRYEIKPLKEVNFGATGVEEVLQNIAFILATVVNSCPMDRSFGWKPAIDSPINIAKATESSRILQAITENETRAIVEEIVVDGEALKGELTVIVRVDIDESI